MGKITKAKANTPVKSATRGKQSTQVKKESSSSDEMPKAAKSKATKGGKKAKKDPKAPKRGLSAYMFYANANRDRVRADNPDITFGQVGKVLGEEWKSLDASEKEKYEEMARKDKIRYEEDKARYNAGEDDDEEGSD